MDVEFTGEYISLGSFKSENLPEFLLVTGKNGCGKSQFLELLNSSTTGLNINPPPKYIQPEGIENNTPQTINNSGWTKTVREHFNQYHKMPEDTKKLLKLISEIDIWDLSEYTNEEVFNHKYPKEYIEEVFKKGTESIYPQHSKHNFNRLLQELNRTNYFQQDKITKMACVASFVAQHKKKEFENLTETDFYNCPIPNYVLGEANLFAAKIEQIFYSYARIRDINQRTYFNKKEYGEINNSIPDPEFLKNNPPPWKVINEIFINNKVDFEFIGIDRTDFNSEANYNCKLIKKSINKEVGLDKLSSGEKVIIGLITKLFTSNYYSENLTYPDLLLLDEPDAHLHPEMTRLLIDVLVNSFVEKIGINVIMVTHSPSTVALCPEESIFQLKNTPSTTLEKMGKEEALTLLTENLPTLSIDYKNHRQVFVESPTDVYYYQTIFNKLRNDKEYERNLYFISNSHGKGNCSQVIKIVDDIRKSGNKTSFGIIDWDLKNDETEFIKIHGVGKRYNVENFIYDPIYLIVLLMDLNAHNIYKELSLDETYNHLSISKESVENLQKFSDYFFSKYYEKYTISKTEQETLVVAEYVNGTKLSIPKWYIEFQGHDLENRLKELFPALAKYRSEGEMQEDLTKIIGKLYPFVPTDTEEVISKIVTAD